MLYNAKRSVTPSIFLHFMHFFAQFSDIEAQNIPAKQKTPPDHSGGAKING